MIKLINDDCMNVMKDYEDDHFDLAIVDPPYGIELDYFNRPKSHYRTGKFSYILRDDAPAYHTKTPDIDNLAKFVADALQPNFYKDDSQIIELKAEKYYVSHGEPARTEVMIDEI